MKHDEFKLQKRVCTYLKYQYPHAPFLSDAISNIKLTKPQQQRNKQIQDQHFKCPDLMVFVPCGGYAGLFLELKKETPFKLNGEIKASPKDHLRKQQEALQRLNALGYNASFQWDFDTIVKLIDDYFKNYHFFPLPNEKE